MGVVFRQSVKSSIVIFFGALLGAVSNLIYPYILSKTELGLLTNIIYLGALLQVFMMLGSAYVLAIYIQRYPEESVKKKVLITLCNIATLATTVIFCIAYILFKQQIISHYQAADRPLIRQYFYWVPVLLLFMSFMALYEGYLLSQTKTAVSAFLREVVLRVLNLVLIALLFYHLISFKVFIISNVLVYGIPAVFLLLISFRTKGFGFSTDWKVFSRKEYKDIIHFAWYHLLLGVSLNVMGYLDTLMLGALDKNGIETVAPYRMAVFIVSLVVIPYRAMSSSSTASLNKAYLENDMPKVHDQFERAGMNILIVTVAMMLIISCNLDNAVQLFGKGYAVIKPIVLVLMIGRFIDLATGLNTELISISKYYKFNFRIAFLLIILVYVFNRALIPRYGIYGAAWSATIAFAIFNLLKLVFLWRKMQLHPFSRKSWSVLAAAVVTALCGFYMPYIINPFADTIMRTGVIIITYGILLILLKPSKDLNNYIISIKQTRRLF